MNPIVELPSGRVINLAGFAQAYTNGPWYIVEWSNMVNPNEGYNAIFNKDEPDAQALKRYIHENSYVAL